jgi:hypothetical protein
VSDDRTPAQIWADHITGATPPDSGQPAPEPIPQPINPQTDSITALHARTEGDQ